VHKGRHLLVDCTEVPRDVCLDDGTFLDAMARAARRAGATVISQVRYQFGHASPPGFAAFVLLDESHCSAHTYAEDGVLALDIFTCGDADPHALLGYLREEIPLGRVAVQEVTRLVVGGSAASRPAVTAGREAGA